MNRLFPQSAASYQPVSTPQREYMPKNGGGIPSDKNIELGDLGSDAFFDEVTSIRDAIKSLDQETQSLSTKQAFSLSQPSNADSELSNQVDSLTISITTSLKKLKVRLQGLSPLVKQGDEARRLQWEALKSSLVRSAEKYRSVEMGQREKVRERVARQVKIVRPDATAEEIKEAVESNGQPQVFAQAMIGARTTEARTALHDAQTRRTELLKLESTLTELAALYTQLADLVIVQDDKFDNLETTARDMEMDVEGAAGEMKKAKVSSASARKKRKICAGIIGVVLLVIVIVVVVQLTGGKGGDTETKVETETTTMMAPAAGTGATAAS